MTKTLFMGCCLFLAVGLTAEVKAESLVDQNLELSVEEFDALKSPGRGPGPGRVGRHPGPGRVGRPGPSRPGPRIPRPAPRPRPIPRYPAPIPRPVPAYTCNAVLENFRHIEARFIGRGYSYGAACQSALNQCHLYKRRYYSNGRCVAR